MAACLGESYERFSVRLRTFPMLPDTSKQKYFDEYMEVGKKDRETGELTRFIVSNDEAFGLEITLKQGFNHGYYGVMIKLSDVHSGSLIWQKKYPKYNAKEPSQKDERILIESIDYAIIDGGLRSNVHMKLAPLVPENDFIKPGANGACRYPRMLEGLCIGVCKYKGAGDIQCTKDEFDLKLKEHTLKLDNYAMQIDGRHSLDTLERTLVHRNFYQKHKIAHKLRLANGVAVLDEDIKKYLTPPTHTKKLFRYSDTQNFYYLWRGEKFFDTAAIAQTPIAPIRQSWDLLTSREREIAYRELSKNDFQQIWSHHYKALGPKPKKSKLYSYEIPRAFKKLQERRRYLDKGEIPQDSEVVGKSEKAAIDLEIRPEKLKFLGKTRITGASRGSGLVAPVPKPAEAVGHRPDIASQPQTDQTSRSMSSVSSESAHIQPASGIAIVGHVSSSTLGEFGPYNLEPVCLECSCRFPSSRAFISHFQATHGHTLKSMEQPAVVGRSSETTNPHSRSAFCNSFPRVSPCLGATESIHTTSNMLTKPASSNSTAPETLIAPSSVCSGSERQIKKGVTECASAKACNLELSSSTTTLQPKIKFEPTFKAPKRPAEFMDLSRSKRPSLAKKPFMETALKSRLDHISNQRIEQGMNPSVSSSANVESESPRPGEQRPSDPMDIDNPVAAGPLKFRKLAPDSSVTTRPTALTPSTQSVELLTSSNVKSKTSKISPSSNAEAVNTIVKRPALPALTSQPSIMDTSNPDSPTTLPFAQALIPVSVASHDKTENSQITPSPSVQAMNASAELPVADQLASNTPPKTGFSACPTANALSTINESTESPNIQIIDLDTWVPSLAFTTTYLSTTTPVPMLKSETDPDKKLDLNVNGNMKNLDAELKILEEEARKKEVELEDALRVAEARKEMNGVRRRIEQLRSWEL
ncbi:hypothetical protein OCU04_003939 [Sclerotinia nivalis]|uniref:C2H2-type domain-containing protein n=1 Tax=Sclerotinia nivalis TaxID=352851 RepID=A0A9X0ASY5_9HELO|nr:hypothetical protein OCU04_003939 [Sclerotinia nivalis]